MSAPLIPSHLDHLVVTVPDFAAGVEEFAQKTGVRAIPGGSHPGKGTANYLLGVKPAGWPAGAHTYLEILGPDPQQKRPADGTLPLDAHLAEGLTLQTWAARPDGFDFHLAAARAAGVDFGEVKGMSRQTPDGTLLEWRLTSKDGGLPGKGTQPFLIDWLDSAHPAEADMPAVELLRFSIESPDVEATRTALEALGVGEVDGVEVVEGDDHRLHATLRGPGGTIEF